MKKIYYNKGNATHIGLDLSEVVLFYVEIVDRGTHKIYGQEHFNPFYNEYLFITIKSESGVKPITHKFLYSKVEEKSIFDKGDHEFYSHTEKVNDFQVGKQIHDDLVQYYQVKIDFQKA